MIDINASLDDILEHSSKNIDMSVPKNAMLSKGKLTISNGALTAITFLVVESKPEEKEVIIISSI